MKIEGLERIPASMHSSVMMWIEHGQPHPRLMGSFMRAVLLHDLLDAFAFADAENSDAMRGWALFLYNDAPSPCHGSEEALSRWHETGGLRGLGGAV